MKKIFWTIVIFLIMVLLSNNESIATASLQSNSRQIVSGESKTINSAPKKISPKTSSGSSTSKKTTINQTVLNALPKPIKSPSNSWNSITSKYQTGDYIEIFEFPDYQWRSTRFYKWTETKLARLRFPSNNISIKFSNESTTIARV